MKRHGVEQSLWWHIKMDIWFLCDYIVRKVSNRWMCNAFCFRIGQPEIGFCKRCRPDGE